MKRSEGRSRGSALRARTSLAIALVLLSATVYLLQPGWIWSHGLSALDVSSDSDPQNPLDASTFCPAPSPAPMKSTGKRNPWEPLTIEELTSVQHWLEHPARDLNLTRAPQSALSDNIIFHIDLYPPTKADTLRYLDENDEFPPRFARVTLHHGAEATPVIKDYLVGPLPVSELSTTMVPLTDIYHIPEIPFNAHMTVNVDELVVFDAMLAESFGDILTELFGSTVDMIATISGPYSLTGEWRRGWSSYRKNVAGPWLHPVAFFNYLDMSGNDPSTWKVLKTVYNNQIFYSADDMRNALRNGTLKRLPPRPDQDSPENLGWTSRNRTLLHSQDRDLDHLPGPRSVSFAGLRFRVDRVKQRVSWMGWEMSLGFDRDMGLSLWDIRIRGERLLYQLAPQEAIAQYAGNDPAQSTTAWLDRFFGMGSSVKNMLPQYDCPSEAVYLPATTYTTMGTIYRERAICVFEQDSGRPITRHMGYVNGEFGAVKGYTLTVRSISTVGNSQFDYIFSLDGTIEVRVSASGYLQGGFYDSEQAPYGGRIRDTSMGNLHDHVINFKVDLDVAGTSNSVLQTRTVQETVTHPWLEEDDGWGTEILQQKIVKDYIKSEKDSRLLWPGNIQGGYALVNEDATNKWGYPRGYSVHPGYNSIHNTIVGSKRLLLNANWAKYNLAVSVRHETEPSSSSMWNMNLPGNPPVDFDKFFDDEESLSKNDLVAWVNVGMHHLPQAEDSPNTKTTTATSSFFLTPLNYFDADISMDSRNAILLRVDGVNDPRTALEFEDYGVNQATSCVPAAPHPFEYFMVKVYDADGQEEETNNLEELRQMHEMYHRVKAEAV